MTISFQFSAGLGSRLKFSANYLRIVHFISSVENQLNLIELYDST